MKEGTEQGTEKNNFSNSKLESSLQEVLTVFHLRITESLSTYSLYSQAGRADYHSLTLY